MDLLDPTWTEIPEGNKRAELYPYSAPQFNFLLNKGELQKLPSSYDLKNKVAILAIGSNRSPSQLLRKFGDNEQVPVTIVNVKAINQKSALLFLKEKINYKNNYNTKKDFLNRIVSEKNYRLNTNKKLNSLGILPNENKWEVIKNIKSDTLKFY